jgi:hypothetical protein
MNGLELVAFPRFAEEVRILTKPAAAICPNRSFGLDERAARSLLESTPACDIESFVDLALLGSMS